MRIAFPMRELLRHALGRLWRTQWWYAHHTRHRHDAHRIVDGAPIGIGAIISIEIRFHLARDRLFGVDRRAVLYLLLRQLHVKTPALGLNRANLTGRQ